MSERQYCHHGNFEGGCPACADEARQKAGRLTVERYELDKHYEVVRLEYHERTGDTRY